MGFLKNNPIGFFGWVFYANPTKTLHNIPWLYLIPFHKSNQNNTSIENLLTITRVEFSKAMEMKVLPGVVGVPLGMSPLAAAAPAGGGYQGKPAAV